MNDEKKTKKQLIHELDELRQRITELEESDTASGWIERALMDSSLDGIMFTETVGYITKVNQHFLELLGYIEEEVIGKFVAELTPEVIIDFTPAVFALSITSSKSPLNLA